MKTAYACNKTLGFMKSPGFVSKNNISQRPFVRLETSRFINEIFQVKKLNISDKWFGVSLLGSNKSILRSPASAMLP